MWFALLWWHRRTAITNRWFLRCVAISGVLTVVALEAGWIVTEVGRQPWTVVGHLLTRDAVTRSGNVWLFYAGTVALYVVVGAATFVALRTLRNRWRVTGHEEDGVPYGPSRAEEPSRAEAQR